MACSVNPASNILDTTGSTIYSKATLVFLAIALFFHTLGVFTESWCHMSWSGQRYTVGLWRGCVELSPKHWTCSRKYSRTAVFGINWGVGSQVLITVALAILLLIEILVFGYTCLSKLTPYRLRLLRGAGGLCLLAGFFTVIGLVVFGVEVTKYPEDCNARIAWSFGMCVLSLLFISATTALIFLDRKLELSALTYRRESMFLEAIPEQHRRY